LEDNKYLEKYGKFMSLWKVVEKVINPCIIVAYIYMEAN
jgi:hypothetical protein